MKETYENNQKLINTIALLVFWAAIYAMFPALGEKGINPDYSIEAAISFGLAVGAVVYLLPLLIAALGSFGMFFTSPIFKRRWRKFQSLKRGYYAFILIISLFVLSFFAEFLINGKALFVKYQGSIHFTLFSFESARSFGLKGYGVPNYRMMKEVYQTRNSERAERVKNGTATEEDQNYKHWGDDWVMLPIYPYGPLESLLDELPCRPPHPPTWLTGRWRQAFFEESLFVLPEKQPTDEELKTKYNRPDWVGLDIAKLYREMAVAGLFELKPGVKMPGTFQHLLGTDDRGRDVFARMVYGFRTSLSFALVVCFFCYVIGITIGALLGYYGGTFDIVMQRFVEIWSAMPFLYTVMIFAAIMIPNFWMLVGILVMFKWMGMTYYIRAEFRVKNRKTTSLPPAPSAAPTGRSFSDTFCRMR